MNWSRASKPPVPAPGKPMRKKTILIVEPADGCYFMLQRAFAQTELPHLLRRVRDGARALAYMLGRDEFADRQCFPFPDLLIADAAVPKVGGIEVLGYLRRELKVNVPGVIFSASLVVFDMRRVVELGRADYFVRPVTFSVLVDVVQSMQLSWLAA
jgi:DNA-binding response OmpR family regulator